MYYERNTFQGVHVGERITINNEEIGDHICTDFSDLLSKATHNCATVGGRHNHLHW